MKHGSTGRETQNVTVALPRELLVEAKHLAVDKGISLSEFMKQLVEDKVERQRRYNEAMEDSLRLMRTSTFRLGPEGITWTREELHER